LLAQGPRAEPLALARVYTCLGRTGGAITVLERASKDKQPLLLMIKAIEWFEPLHGDRRFIEPARRMRLPE
jgi:hypothetical protein